MSHEDSTPARLQIDSSDINRITPPQRLHPRGKTLPTTAGVHASKQHRAPTWSPGQIPDVEDIPSPDVRAGILPKGAQRPTPPSALDSRTTTSQDLVPDKSAKSSVVFPLGNSVSNVPKLNADDTTLSLDGIGGSLQALSPSPSPAVSHVSPYTPYTSTDPGISSITLNTSDDQTTASANPLPGDTQSPLEDPNAEAGITFPIPTLSRPNLNPMDHSYLSSETMHSSNEATGGKNEMALDSPIASVEQEPGISTHPHRWSKWGESFKGLRTQCQRWRLHWKLWCLLAMVIAVSLGIPIGFALRVRDIAIPIDPGAKDRSMVLLSTNLVSMNPEEKTATFDWFVDGAFCDSDPCQDYDIFFDQNILTPSAGGNDSIPSDPVFSINGTLFRGVNESLLANLPFFTTNIHLFGGENSARKERTLQAYPFDHYMAQIFIFAKVKNNTFNINDLAAISIDHSDGIAVGFTATMDRNNSVNEDFVILNIDVARGRVVRIYCVVIVIAIWLVTLALLSVTISVVFLRREMAKEVMVVPVATLFAFTQLRGTFPGAPSGFGAIVDFIGVLPCLAIISLCSVLLLAVFLFYDPENPRARKDKSDPAFKHL